MSTLAQMRMAAGQGTSPYAKLIRAGVKPDRYSKAMVEQFCYAMDGVRYNREKFQVAWHWFRTGWERCRGMSQ